MYRVLLVALKKAARSFIYVTLILRPLKKKKKVKYHPALIDFFNYKTEKCVTSMYVLNV